MAIFFLVVISKSKRPQKIKYLKISIILVIIVFLAGCNGCINSLYQVHEDDSDLHIGFDLKIHPKAILSYLDSFYLRDTSDYCLGTSFNEDSLNKDQRIILFKSTPIEYYRVRCDCCTLLENVMTIHKPSVV
jgi:hypothetical protein